MQLILSALRRPLTVMVIIVAIGFGAFLAVGGSVCEQLGLPYPPGLPRGMEVDIFPSLNLPVIYVCQPYGGMDPAQMEGYLTNYYEYHFLYITGIHHVESRNIQGMALMKLHREHLDASTLEQTLGCVLKVHEDGDVVRAHQAALDPILGAASANLESGGYSLDTDFGFGSVSTPRR